MLTVDEINFQLSQTRDPIEISILTILNNLNIKLSHDCHRCGGYMFENSYCSKCNEYDKKMLEERIPFLEYKLKKYRETGDPVCDVNKFRQRIN